jgi:hypothetical protein
VTNSHPDITRKRRYNDKLAVFSLLWIVVFILYLPAAKAGRVGDFPGWVRNVSTMSFWDYVNRTESHIPSLYQFTQMVTYVFYHLFGTKAWLWHLLYVSLQAINGYFLFVLFRGLFTDAKIKDASTIALAGSILFCVCPHISEVVVWEPSFHYLQGFLLILLTLLCAQKFMQTQNNKYAWFAGILFFLSTYSLEIFYLTPLFVFTLCLYYYLALGSDKGTFRKSLVYFLMPQVVLFIAHLLLINAIYHSGIGHIGTETMKLSAGNFSKPLKYIFHLLFFGRYFHDDVRQKIYAYCESVEVLATFYVLLVLISGMLIFRFKKLAAKSKASGLLFLWVLFSVGLICPIWFPDSFVVIYDRYTYVLDAFLYMLIALLISYITIRMVAIGIWGLFTLVNVYFTHKVNKMWKVSGDIVNKLVSTFPNDPSKTVLIMNVPECFYGVQMIGSREEGEFKILYNAVMPQKINNPVFEVSASNIIAPDNGAHVMVINDTLLHVTLNQWGTWWWWFGLGAKDYENEYYQLKLTDPGHWYELMLKKPSSQYLLLYIVGDQWRVVDMNKKSVDQN